MARSYFLFKHSLIRLEGPVAAESSTAFGISARPLVQQTIRTESFTFFALLRSSIRTSQSF